MKALQAQKLNANAARSAASSGHAGHGAPPPHPVDVNSHAPYVGMRFFTFPRLFGFHTYPSYGWNAQGGFDMLPADVHQALQSAMHEVLRGSSAVVQSSERTFLGGHKWKVSWQWADAHQLSLDELDRFMASVRSKLLGSKVNMAFSGRAAVVEWAGGKCLVYPSKMAWPR